MPHTNEDIWYLSFSVWGTWLSTMTSGPSTECQMVGFPSFYGWVTLHCVYRHRPYFFYLFICQWTCGVLPSHDCCEPCCPERGGADVSWRDISGSWEHPSSVGTQKLLHSGPFQNSFNIHGTEIFILWVKEIQGVFQTMILLENINKKQPSI